MKKLKYFYFIIMASITISLMLWDYHTYPFNAQYQRTGNQSQSFLLYPMLVCIEFSLILFTIHFFKRNSHFGFKIVFLFLWFGITFISFIDTMRGGGVLAAHALWLLLVSLSLTILLFTETWLKNRKTL
jgi:hypothetical protein